MVKFHNIEQKTDKWFDLRKGKLTASHATEIAANGKGLKTYTKNIVLELIGVEKENYINSDMERGNELEETARLSYEFENGVEVKEVGFITNSDFENVGASPDGIVGIDGGIEIKARNDIKHLSLILGEKTEIPVNQIQMTLLITNRKWWDFVSFNPNFSKPIFIERIYPDLVYFEKLKKGFETGNKLINFYKQLYNNF